MCLIYHIVLEVQLVLMIHIPVGIKEGNWDIARLEEDNKIKRGVDVYYTDGCNPRNHLSPNVMPFVYNMMDILLYPSGGEGFGIPVLEAMASEVPIVFTNYSAHGELASNANAGIGISGTLVPEVRSGVRRMVPCIEEGIESILRLCNFPAERAVYGHNGREFACRHGIATVIQMWDELFTEAIAARNGVWRVS